MAAYQTTDHGPAGDHHRGRREATMVYFPAHTTDRLSRERRAARQMFMAFVLNAAPTARATVRAKNPH